MNFKLPNFKKRTPTQINKSVAEGDYTGGYQFLPWLFYYQKLVLVAFFLNIFFGVKAFGIYINAGNETFTAIVSVYFGLLIPSLIVFLLVREYKQKKKGISK